MWPVMLFADSVALAVLFLTPVPVFNIMGGVRLSEREQIIVFTVYSFRIASVATWFIWLLGTLIVQTGPLNWRYVLADELPKGQGKISPSLWGLAAAAICVWLVILPRTQPEQRLRHAVETDFSQRRIADAVHKMSGHRPEDFPRHWDPPPYVAYAEEGQLPLLDVLEVVIDPAVPAWIQDVYAEKLENQLREWSWFETHRADIPRLLAVLKRMPRGREIVLVFADNLHNAKKYSPERYPDDAEFVGEFDRLLDWAGYKPQEPAESPSSP